MKQTSLMPLKLSDVADVVRWNKSLDMSDSPKHIAFELSATKGFVELLPNNEIYERHAVIFPNDNAYLYTLAGFLSEQLDAIRHKYLENMNFKINDVKNVEVNEYFAQFI